MIVELRNFFKTKYYSQKWHIAVKHLKPRFLTTFVRPKYLKVFLRNLALTNLNIYTNLLWATIWLILLEERSRRPNLKFTNSTELKSNCPFAHVPQENPLTVQEPSCLPNPQWWRLGTKTSWSQHSQFTGMTPCWGLLPFCVSYIQINSHKPCGSVLTLIIVRPRQMKPSKRVCCQLNN